MSRQEARFSGFGGQGIILAGVILGRAATIYDGKYATLTQNYGPESRGGACTANIVISQEPVSFPNVVKPTTQVLMSQEAFNKYSGEVEGATILIDEDLVKPVNGAPKVRLLSVPATRIADALGRRIIANIVMLGFFTAITRLVSEKAMIEAICASVPKGTQELNLEAFRRGFGYGQACRQEAERNIVAHLG